jgi:hypothetical protein
MSSITSKFIEKFEKVQGRLSAFHGEIGLLSKKSPDAKLNDFKLKFINAAILDANELLKDNRPFDEFEQFDSNSLPSHSDVVMILAQYITCLDDIRTNHISFDSLHSKQWYWNLGNGEDGPVTSPPLKTK